MKLKLTLEQCHIIGTAWTKYGKAGGAMIGLPYYDAGFIGFAVFSPPEARRIKRVLKDINKARRALK